MNSETDHELPLPAEDDEESPTWRSSPTDEHLGVSTELSPGTDVGEYQITGRLGAGGMGIVYSAIHPVIGKRAAVKVISRHLAEDESVLGRFVQEARAVNQIRHPNIVDIFSFGRLGDKRAYLIMELLDGEPLNELIRRETLDWPTVFRLFDQVLRAVQAAHAQQIVHRDLKPANIFLATDGAGGSVVKVLDFGIAKLQATQQAAPEQLTTSGMLLGTPTYMSPEQARCLDVGPATDTYALGVMLFELTTGERPYHGDSIVDLVIKHVQDPVPDPRNIRSEMSQPLAELIMAMMEKSPGQRPGLRQVRQILAAEFLRLTGQSLPSMDIGQSSDALPPLFSPPRTVTQDPVSHTNLSFESVRVQSPKPSRKRIAWITGGSVVVGLAGSLLWAQATDTSAPSEPAARAAFQSAADGTPANPSLGREMPSKPGRDTPAAPPTPAKNTAHRRDADKSPPRLAVTEAVEPAQITATESPPSANPTAVPEWGGRLTVIVPTKNAIVRVDSKEVETVDGIATIEFKESGKHRVDVSAPGFHSFHTSVGMRGQPLVVEAILDEKPAPTAKAKPAKKRRIRTKRKRKQPAPSPSSPGKNGALIADPFE